MAVGEGSRLDHRYVIVRRIADGGTSTVFSGVHERIGKRVAVKVLHTEAITRDPELKERMLREARVMSRIRSAHVTDVFDYGELPSGEPFIVMEHVEGESLARLLERERILSPDKLAPIAMQILEALAMAHRAGVVHRDLKPENVLIVERSHGVHVKVIDFGISITTDGKDAAQARLTTIGTVLGTPLYMSPEQARGQTEHIDRRTDLYSLGVMLYEAVSGAPPFTGRNMNDLLFRVALDEPRPLRAAAPHVDPAFADIVSRAMKKSPAERYQTADEMLRALEHWSASRRRRERPLRAGVSAAALALVAMLLSVAASAAHQNVPRNKTEAEVTEASGTTCMRPVVFAERGDKK